MFHLFHSARRIITGALLAVLVWTAGSDCAASSRSELVYLDENDPFYPGIEFPRLTTPQWVGEPGVEAVVILAIDDLNEPAKWENFLRPILERLKAIDGRAPASIMTVTVDPTHPQLQSWLKEGVSLETHTLTHPCPCLAGADFPAASRTYAGSVELMNRIPGNRPVAFRMPCCDSMNSPSPRFYAEIFDATNAAGQFLRIDSSVMNIMTTNDSVLPRELLIDADGHEKFRKYIPSTGFVTTIENYPYPYVIGKLCWEFPAVVPSDWEAQHRHGTNNPVTVADWEAALDGTVLKQGVMNLIFHPHGWIRNDQIVELIDYAVRKYGNKVKFLNFREAQERLDKNLLQGHPLRASQGEDGGVRLLDLNHDGYLDVVSANGGRGETSVWDPQSRTWARSEFPFALVLPNKEGRFVETGGRFGVIQSDGRVSVLVRNAGIANAWTFDGARWVEDSALLNGLELSGTPVLTGQGTSVEGMRDAGARLRDVDGDGRCEFIIGNPSQNAVFSWNESERRWQARDYALPPGVWIVDGQGRDAGLRFIDVNEDGYPDLIFSNEKKFSLNLYIPKPYLGFENGWSREVLSGRQGEPGAIPMITRKGSNNGAWFHGRELCVQNEDTAALAEKIERRSFDSLLAGLQPPPLSPEESLKSMRVQPGFSVELAAHEPLTESPVAFEWGADGKLWVVEMGDYPLGVDGKGRPGGRVRFLEDTNQDGTYDKSTLFLDGLNFPTGLIPWGKGIIVSAAPDIFYAEDTDGDGKPDIRKTLFTGFHEGNQQHRLNGFDYGLDNWVYGANGDSGGTIRTMGRLNNSALPSGAKSVDIRGRDFRFRPGDGSFETQAGGTQFGRHRDDWGNWFGNNNSIWLWHYFLPEQYVRRNPYLAVETNKRILADYEDATRVFPRSRPLQRFNDIGAAGHVTSANSATPYRDDLFGPDFAISIFISEPVYNLVHREVLQPDGVSFQSHRASGETNSEFLASTDNWFRPTMLKTGPDGALYIADIYRLVIEHPEWIPEDVKHRLDLRAGADKGRIYRVLPAGPGRRKIPRLDQLDAAGLVAALENSNGWQRDTAQRLLVEGRSKTAAPLLRAMVQGGHRPQARLQALCALEGIGAVTPEVLRIALKDPIANVRENAVRITESMFEEGRLAVASGPEGKVLAEALLSLTEDSSLRVRYQLAFTLGGWNDSRAAQALVKLASRDSENPEMQTAVMSSAPAHVAEMLVTVLQNPSEFRSEPGLLKALLNLATAVRNDTALEHALEVVGKADRGDHAAWQFAAVAAVLDALEGRGDSLSKLHSRARAGLRKAIEGLDGFFQQAQALAESRSSTTNDPRLLLAAVPLLGRGRVGAEQDVQRIGDLLGAKFPEAVQGAALAGLRRIPGNRAGEVLLANWKTSGPALRTELLQTLLARQEWIPSLLKAIEQGQIAPGQIGLPQQQKLRANRDEAIRDRADKLFAAGNPDRAKVVASYRAAADLRGDRGRGASLFQSQCALCHAPEARYKIGPDLGALAEKPFITLSEAILDPNRAVEARYVSYSAETLDGREFNGIITAESANSITVRSPNSEDTILRAHLKQLTSSGLSPMPEGFEKLLTPQDLADVIAYLTRN